MRDLRVTKYDKALDSDWEDMISSAGCISFFQMSIWGNILADANVGFEYIPLSIVFSDGAKVVIPLCLQRVRKVNVIRTCYSMPFGTYGGMLCQGSISSVHIDLAIELIRHAMKPVYFVWFPHPLSAILRNYLEMVEVSTESYTHILDLSRGIDEISDEFSDSARWGARRAQRGGVLVEVSNSLDDFREYYAMLEESSRRWGINKPEHPWGLFASIQKYAQSNPASIKLWLAKLNGQPIAGALCFYSKDEVFYWSGAMLAAYARYQPNNAIQDAIIRDACQGGYKIYNMGASGNLTGVRRFKEAWGAKEVKYRFYTWESPLFYTYRKLRQFFASLVSVRKPTIRR